jgi:hypothetical protein
MLSGRAVRLATCVVGVAGAVAVTILTGPGHPGPRGTPATVPTLHRGWYVLHLEHGTETLWDGPYSTPISCVDALGSYVREYPHWAFVCRGTRGIPDPALRAGRPDGGIWTETLSSVRDRAMATREIDQPEATNRSRSCNAVVGRTCR